jgi:hypothetical protein
LTTPVGGGIRSINVALRQERTYVCRPVRYFAGVPARSGGKTDMVIFASWRTFMPVSNSSGLRGRRRYHFLIGEMKVKKIVSQPPAASASSRSP